jgi:hypothetical protein
MAMKSYEIVVGVFEVPGMAERAIEALQNAGFSANQIRHSGHSSSGGFMESIKRFFTGQGTESGSIVGELTNMGVSNDAANFYDNEHKAGHPVVAVNANGREQEVKDILSRNGAYDYQTRDARMAATQAPTADNPRTDQPTGPTRTDEANETEQQRAMRLQEEQPDATAPERKARRRRHSLKAHWKAMARGGHDELAAMPARGRGIISGRESRGEEMGRRPPARDRRRVKRAKLNLKIGFPSGISNCGLQTRDQRVTLV